MNRPKYKNKTQYASNPISNNKKSSQRSFLKDIGSSIMEQNKCIKINDPNENKKSFASTFAKNNTNLSLNNINGTTTALLQTISTLKQVEAETAKKKAENKLPNDYFLNKIPINLEDLLIQEERLWLILTTLRLNADYSIYAEDYLEFSHISSLQTFEPFFNEKKYKENLRINSMNEYISVILSILALITNKLCEVSATHLKNLLYYLHQNILLIISVILDRMDREYIDNIWGNRLKEIVFHRLSPDTKKGCATSANTYGQKSGSNEFFYINQNNSIISSMLKNFLDIYFRSNNVLELPIYKYITAIINDPLNTNISIWSIKNTLSKMKVDLLNTIMVNNMMSAYRISPKEPYLPPLQKDKYTYSLVLDLDETLVHSIAEIGKTLIRPFAEEFLEELYKDYEIIIFTAAMKDYADNLLNSMDKGKGMIQHRLYRQHTVIENGVNVKDISKLGRDLSKVIIIDNISDNFQKQKDNGIFITTWLGDENDTELKDLVPILKCIAKLKANDVRKVLRNLRDYIIRLYVNGDPKPLDTVNQNLRSIICN